MQMISVQSQGVVSNEPQDISNLLDRFHKVFDEPNGLPSQRSHDHQIPLK